MSVLYLNDQVNAEVVKERPISVEDVTKNIGEFLKKRYVSERLSAENYSRLHALQAALVEEATKEKTTRKQKRSRSSSETELTAREPGRKKKRRRRIT